MNSLMQPIKRVVWLTAFHCTRCMCGQPYSSLNVDNITHLSQLHWKALVNSSLAKGCIELFMGITSLS